MTKRIAAICACLTLPLLLAACLLAPGKFTSSLDIRKTGQFAFTYKGEISMLGLAQLAAMGRKQDEEFKPETCYADAPKGKRSRAERDADDDSPSERKCTDAEIAEQKANWESARKNSAEKEKKDLDQAKAMLGGLDPTDPKSIDDFVARLRRQAGWQAVNYKGDGKFEVDYAITGRLDHDFIFPIIEKFPTANTFVQVLRRNDGTVRIDAPGFFASSGSSPWAAMGMGMAGGMSGDGNDKDLPKPAEIDGIFTLTTNGAILSNNTDEGPQADTTGQRLSWTINPRTAAAPMALVRLGN